MQPVEAVLLVHDELNRRKLNRAIDYDATALTTAGHTRIPGADTAKIMAGNIRTARLAAVMLERKGDLEGKNFALSADMGNTGWHQLEWNILWPRPTCVKLPEMPSSLLPLLRRRLKMTSLKMRLT